MKGMSPTVNFAAFWAKIIKAQRSWTQVSLFITLMLIVSRLINNLGVNAAEFKNSTNSHGLSRQRTAQFFDLGASIEQPNIHLRKQSTSTISQSKIQSSGTPSSATVNTVLKTAPQLPEGETITSLPPFIGLGQASTASIKSSPYQARLLLPTLRKISPNTRKSKGFYGVASPLRSHRRVPRSTAIARKDLPRPKTSPQGKPANGFVFISSVFGKRPNPFGRGLEFHNGIDLVGAKGLPILATADGQVVTYKRGRGYGIHVVVDHGSGYKTLYAHLSKKRVKKNQKVKRGQIIGYLGSTGRSTGPHLHYSVYFNQQAVDPRPYIFFK